MGSSKAAAGLHAGFLLRTADAPAIERDVEVRYDGDGIVAIAPRQPGAAGGSARSLLMPPLANAHDHGRGIKTLAYGASDTAVEAWVPATYTLPPVDPYLVAAAAFARMARSGIGYAVHCHLSRDPRTLLREAEAVSRAARDVGIRIGFVVPLRDRHRLGLGADEAILRLLDPPDAEVIRARSLRPLASIDEQIAVVDEIAAACESDNFKVQYGPVGVEYCSDAMLERVASASHASGRRVHMHLLESRYQREWTDHAYPHGVVEQLRAIGLLSPRLTVAHGTWLRPAECELLARAGVLVSINTSSNLRLRSGIAPLRQIHAAGLRFAVGLDALALDDDDDLLRELRLLRLLHAGTGFDVGVPREVALDAACRQGARAAGFDGAGEIGIGAPADLLLLDLRRETADLCEPFLDIGTVLHARATAASVHTLVVGGRGVVQAGRVTGVEEAAVQEELKRQLATHADGLGQFAPVLQRLQEALAGFYASGGHCCSPPP